MEGPGKGNPDRAAAFRSVAAERLEASTAHFGRADGREAPVEGAAQPRWEAPVEVHRQRAVVAPVEPGKGVEAGEVQWRCFFLRHPENQPRFAAGWPGQWTAPAGLQN